MLYVLPAEARGDSCPRERRSTFSFSYWLLRSGPLARHSSADSRYGIPHMRIGSLRFRHGLPSTKFRSRRCGRLERASSTCRRLQPGTCFLTIPTVATSCALCAGVRMVPVGKCRVQDISERPTNGLQTANISETRESKYHSTADLPWASWIFVHEVSVSLLK